MYNAFLLCIYGRVMDQGLDCRCKWCRACLLAVCHASRQPLSAPPLRSTLPSAPAPLLLLSPRFPSSASSSSELLSSKARGRWKTQQHLLFFRHRSSLSSTPSAQRTRRFRALSLSTSALPNISFEASDDVTDRSSVCVELIAVTTSSKAVRAPARGPFSLLSSPVCRRTSRASRAACVPPTHTQPASPRFLCLLFFLDSQTAQEGTSLCARGATNVLSRERAVDSPKWRPPSHSRQRTPPS
jgi:hypothetical protein